MSWLRKALVHLALSRSDAALVKAAGGTPRTVRNMTLDPRFQYIEAEARKRAAPEGLSVTKLREDADTLSYLFGGAKARGVRVERAYVTGRSHSVPCRLYLPTVRDNSAPLLVYYHSGGGVAGSLESCHRLCGLIARQAGTPVLSVEYRLAPEYPFPAGLDDAIAAYAWAVDNAARFGAPVGKAAVGGDSMGANFAAAVAQEFKGARAPVLQVLIYPAVDFVSDAPSMHDFADAFPLTAEVADFFTQHYLGQTDPSDPRASPGRAQNLRGLAPALVYLAGFDMLLDQGEAYAERLREEGVRVECVRFDALPHGFVAMPSASPAAEAAVRRIARETAAALKSGL